MYAYGEHPGVLAGAVAVDGLWFLAAARELGRRRGVERRVCAALEILLRESGFLQDGTDGGEVRLLGVVRGAGNCQLFLGET
jgi:hypothetical protein